MKYKTRREWAASKVASQVKSIGFSSYTEDFLMDNFNQVQFDQVAGLSKYLYSSQLYLASLCQTEEALKRNTGPNASINVHFQHCHSEFKEDKVNTILEQLDYVSSIVASMRRATEEMIELQKLPKE